MRGSIEHIGHGNIFFNEISLLIFYIFIDPVFLFSFYIYAVVYILLYISNIKSIR